MQAINTNQKISFMERHILLIDDDEDEFLILSNTVANMPGVHCSYASNSRNGIEILKTGLPDMVLLDMNMPAINGLKCLEYIKQIKEISHIPVFLYSTSLTDTYSDRAHNLGASGCLQKTSSPEVLHDMIIRILKLTASKDARFRLGRGSI